MSYTVSASSTISYADSIESTRFAFKLPLTELKGLNPAQNPNVFTSIIAAGAFQTFDLANLGLGCRLIAAKSTRPVSLFLVTAAKEFELPRATYFTYLVDSKEAATELITSVRVEVPAAPATAPSPAPARYPNAVVEILAVLSAS